MLRADDQLPGAIIVRAARREDLPAASMLAAELVRQHHAYDPRRFMSSDRLEEGYERFLRTQVDRDDVVLLVAVLHRGEVETIVGYILGSLEDRDWSDLRDACGKIHDVYVDDASACVGSLHSSSNRPWNALRPWALRASS